MTAKKQAKQPLRKKIKHKTNGTKRVEKHYK